MFLFSPVNCFVTSESEVASIHSWPDADASMVASERAISVANEALHSSEYNVRVPVPPETALARVIQQLEARPQQTKVLSFFPAILF